MPAAQVGDPNLYLPSDGALPKDADATIALHAPRAAVTRLQGIPYEALVSQALLHLAPPHRSDAPRLHAHAQARRHFPMALSLPVALLEPQSPCSNPDPATPYIIPCTYTRVRTCTPLNPPMHLH